ncbi:hypothetical protein PTKIN_Ptkin19aG0130900 [Pterospermum kingtungense]
MAIGYFSAISFFHANNPFVYGSTVVEKNHCSGYSGHKEGGLPIFHRHGPCAPSSQRKPPPATPPSTQMFLQDESRANSYGRRDGRKDTQHTTWVNFQPSLGFPSSKHMQKKYCPSSSSTSSNYTYFEPSCDYTQSYYDNSSASEYFVRDELTIPSDLRRKNFVFLCAQNHEGNYDEASAGVLGLGQGGNGNEHEKEGYLYFGKKALAKCKDSANYSPLFSDPSYYYVNLIAITIGQKRLNISSAVSSSSTTTRSTIIDSGTTITSLAGSIYSALRSEFIELMSGYPLPHQNGKLDTCYNLEGEDNFKIPDMVLHFENLDVPLDQTAVIWKEKDMSQVCLAFAAKQYHLTIIGGHQLQNLNVLYNIQDRRVEIGPGNC